MNHKEDAEALLHYRMAFIGGYFGLYAVLTRNELFGSAQTNNLLCLVWDLLGHNPLDFVIRIGAMLIYMTAVGLAVWIPAHNDLSMRKLAVLVDALALVILGFLPADMNPVIGLYPMFFAMPFQWCCFKGAYGFASSSIFSTNNLRQFTMAGTHYFLMGERESFLKFKFYGLTLATFHLGAALAFLAGTHLGVKGIWLGLIPAAVAYQAVSSLEGEWLLLHHRKPAVACTGAKE